MSDEGFSVPVPPENKSGKPRTPQRGRIPRRYWENAAFILLQFRDGYANDIGTLFEVLGVHEALRKEIGVMPAGRERSIMHSFTYMILNAVHGLIDAGLLQADDPEDRELKKTKIRVTPLLYNLRMALDLSLTFLASVDRSRCMVVEPLFGLVERPVEGLDVFVLMPFKADMLPVYEDHIKPTCASMGLTVQRADDFFTAHSVVQDVWNAIVSARSIVADCTDRNPNVFYEIGLAHTIGKPTVLLTQRAEDIPFDLRHLRYIEYQLTPRGMKEFETKFKQTVQTVLSAE
jgi:hypothetical protein